MPNPQLEQFSQALFWKIVPWLILAGAVGTFGGLFVKWLERRAIRFGQDWRNKRAARRVAHPTETKRDDSEAPHCPICNAAMVKRTAKRGPRAGSAFWGCVNYPDCRGNRDI
jgi:hypothetical protein